MFAVDERTAEAIRRAYEDGGELAGAVELRRHFPLIADNSHARLCVRAIAGWKALPDPNLGTSRTGPAARPAARKRTNGTPSERP
jgi:hypothetical protein